MRRSATIRRRGFTIIELLVVIGIIVLLAGLLVSAIAKFQRVGPQVQTRSDIGQLETAIANFKSTYDVEYVPTALILANDYSGAATTNPTYATALADSQRYLRRVWPKMNPLTAFPNNISRLNDGIVRLDGNQVLVFLLGGIPPNYDPNDPNTPNGLYGSGWQSRLDGATGVEGAPFTGFANSAINPFNISPFPRVAASRALPPSYDATTNITNPDRAKGPFFDFKPNRLDENCHYLDPYGTPYYYFSSRGGNDYQYFAIYQPMSAGFNANGGYGNMSPFKGPDGRFMHPNGFQIISAGNDKLPGPGGSYEPGVGQYGPAAQGGDDIANFHQGLLGSD